MPSSTLLFPFSPLSFSFQKNRNFSKESVSFSRKGQVKSATFFFQKAKTLPEIPAVQWLRRPARREGSNKLQLPCILISMLFPKILNPYNYFIFFLSSSQALWNCFQHMQVQKSFHKEQNHRSNIGSQDDE